MKRIVRRIFNTFGYEIIRHSGRDDVYFQDGLYTDHNHDFVQDPSFVSAYERGIRGTVGQEKIPGPWRVHVALWAAQHALRLEGDFVECGVYLGFVSSAVMSSLDWNNRSGERRFWLVDNFEGVVDSLLSEQETELGRDKEYGDRYKGTFERATKNLSEFKNIEIVKGTVPEALSRVTAERVSYLHLDMNSAEPEVAALRFFWPRLVKGGIALFDDYAYASYRPQKVALDALANELGFRILSLPTGQGIAIK